MTWGGGKKKPSRLQPTSLAQRPVLLIYEAQIEGIFFAFSPRLARNLTVIFLPLKRWQREFTLQK